MFGLLGGVVDSIFGASDAKKNRQMQQQQFADQMTFNREQADLQQQNYLKNFDYQDVANKNTIQWRKEDAEKAGIHPLLCLVSRPRS